MKKQLILMMTCMAGSLSYASSGHKDSFSQALSESLQDDKFLKALEEDPRYRQAVEEADRVFALEVKKMKVKDEARSKQLETERRLESEHEAIVKKSGTPRLRVDATGRAYYEHFTPKNRSAISMFDDLHEDEIRRIVDVSHAALENQRHFGE